MLHRSGNEVVELRIDSPATRNALGLDELETLADELDNVGSARVVLLTATGRVFSSGANLAEMSDPIKVARSVALLTRIIERIGHLEQPVVCRVNGDAYGAGVAIIAAADISIASARAHIALPEVRFGMIATVAAATCVRRAGLTDALDLFLTGRRISAGDARRMNLLAEVVADEELDETIRVRVSDLLLAAPTAVAVTKRLVRALSGPSVADELAAAAELGQGASLDEARIGAAAMAARTEPPWVLRWTPRTPV